MDKRKETGTDSKTFRDKGKFGSFDLTEGPKSITVWKDGKYWLIYDQTNDLMTQGKSYQDAIFMLSDALKNLEEIKKE